MCWALLLQWQSHFAPQNKEENPLLLQWQSHFAPQNKEDFMLDKMIGFIGAGNMGSAMIGGILLGIIEILGKAYISSQLADAIVFAVLIVVLVVKPTGLLGKQIQEKV